VRGHVFILQAPLLVAAAGLVVDTAAAQAPCDAPANEIVAENCLPGNPSSEWDISGAGDPSIQGFATDISVERGATIGFKIKTDAADYRIDIYRLGYYAGLGARKVATVLPSATLPQTQPPCLTDTPWTGLRDCGNWAESASWQVPPDAISGIYIATPVRLDTFGASHIPFVVRDDDGSSHLMFQTSDTTWQAYNRYGGNDAYGGDGPATNSRGHKLSYNRPFTTRADHATESVFHAEYPMVRWLEANGYDVSYFTGVDSDRFGAEMLEHEVFLSVGHDEYWSAAQRANVEAARDAGVHLAFFSGNEIYWKIRWESSVDGSGSPHRTLVCYKEGTLGDNGCGTKCDPLENVWTGTWRDGCSFRPPADGCRPENAVSGQISWIGTTHAIEVPEADGKMRFWRNTDIANLSPGLIATLPHGTLGYEWNFEQSTYTGFYPPARVWMSTTNADGLTHHLSLYRHSSGALVFAAGSVQWSWGLDRNHDRGSNPPDVRMQQATVNLLADMGVQPGSLQAGLVAATASTDTIAPTSTVLCPLADSTVARGTAIEILGTAADAGGGVVGAVEVSVDGGATWQRATGRENWRYNWTPSGALGSVTVKSRAADDSVHLETPSAEVIVTVGKAASPPPHTPRAANDTYVYESDENTTLSVAAPGVLENDSDPDGDPFTVVLWSNVSHGTLSLDPDGSFVYTPADGFTGIDSFIYRARDPTNNVSNRATVTIAIVNCPCGIWSDADTPRSPWEKDDRAAAIGVKFRSDVDGFIAGVRFYKDVRNNGTHVGHLWTGSGTLLASDTFTGETASGWQEVLFSTPVAISANTTYVASYHTSTGYPQDSGYFAISGVDNAPLHALRAGEDGPNGVYVYDPPFGTGGFPTQRASSSNYWVDVVFRMTGEAFFRGDANADGEVNIADAVSIFGFLFQGGGRPGCLDAADTNDDGFVDISDGIRILLYLFASGLEPPDPGGESCGIDPTDDDGIDCSVYEHCP